MPAPPVIFQDSAPQTATPRLRPSTAPRTSITYASVCLALALVRILVLFSSGRPSHDDPMHGDFSFGLTLFNIAFVIVHVVSGFAGIVYGTIALLKPNLRKADRKTALLAVFIAIPALALPWIVAAVS